MAEYAETFPVVGGDFSFYQFPTREYWKKLFGESPGGLRFGLKVPEEITVATWPKHARYGARAGEINDSFLAPDRFERQFAAPLLPYGDRVATIIFEFGTFSKATFATPPAFYARLDAFLEALPPGFRYAVEIRNGEYLGSDYFSMLSRHNSAHVFNAWTRMPDLGTQSSVNGAFTADFTVVRALLRRGRTYEQAVSMFEPYESVLEPDSATRAALAEIARCARQPASRHSCS